MVIPQTQAEIWKYLDDTFSHMVPDELISLSDAIDGLLPDLLTSLIAVTLSNGKDDYVEGSPYFYTQNNKYQISAAPDLFHGTSFNIAIHPVGIDSISKRPKKKSISLNTIGPFTTINLYLSQGFNIDSSSLLQEISYLVSAVYGWLLEAIRRSIRNTEEQIESKIISVTRRYFSSAQLEQFLKDTWIIFIFDNKAYYALDTLSAENIIAKASASNSINTGLSPAKMVSEFISNAVPFDETFSKLAISDNKTIDVDISEAKYRAERTDFELSQEKIYNTKSMTFQPLVRESKAMVVAVYPTDEKQAIHGVFEQESQELTTFLTQELNVFNRNWSRLNKFRKNCLEASRFGEFIGGLVKGFTS